MTTPFPNPILFFDSIPPLLQPHFPGNRPLWDVLDTIGDMIWDIATRARKDFDEIENGIFVGHGTRIDKNVVIYGPAIIGAHCHIRSSAYIRENVIIGNNCTIGNSTEVKNAILFNHVDAPHFNYIGDSILGNYVHLGAGVILSNFRLDHGLISIKQQNGEPIPTNRNKLGAIIGDHVEVGCNSVLNPGTLLEKGVVVYPLSNIGGYYQK